MACAALAAGRVVKPVTDADAAAGRAFPQRLPAGRRGYWLRPRSNSTATAMPQPKTSRRRLIALAACALPLAFAAGARAQTTYPAKPIHIVVTFTTGGAPDILARLIGERLQQTWGQSVVIDNKPGAGGNIGADYTAKQPGDGYTLVIGTVGTHSINGALYAKMPYDMVKDFSPISLLATTPNMLVVHPSSPAKNLKEFIELGKKEGKFTFASSGSGTSIHVSGELFKTMTGLDMTHIPYSGRATAIPDVLGGRVTMMFDNMPSSLPLVREGKLRALGLTSKTRSAAAPDIPTIAEQGLPNFEAVSWFAMFAPANLPKPVVDKLSSEVRKIITSPEISKRLLELGLEPVGSSPEELAAYQRAEITKWSKVVKDSGARVE